MTSTALPPLRHGEAISADGTCIRFATAGTGPALVLVHGTLADHRSAWTAVLRRLSRSFLVFAPDRRGRGLSPAPAPWRLEDEARDLGAVVDVARRATGEERIRVVAHSWGAHCALRAAAAGAPIDALVLYEPPHPYGTERRVALEEAVATGDPETFLTVFLRLPPDRLAGLRHTPRWLELLALTPSAIEEVRAFLSATELLSRHQPVEGPVLVLVGERSEPARHAYLAAMAASFPASECRVLPGAGHFAMRDDPAAFTSVVVDFLTRVASGSWTPRTP